jgi:hypothetical protein
MLGVEMMEKRVDDDFHYHSFPRSHKNISFFSFLFFSISGSLRLVITLFFSLQKVAHRCGSKHETVAHVLKNRIFIFQFSVKLF